MKDGHVHALTSHWLSCGEPVAGGTSRPRSPCATTWVLSI